MDNQSSNSTISDNNNDNENKKLYKGVRKRKWGKWVSEIRLPNSRERIWLGSHDSPEKAARAFDAALFCLRGPHASFNFPETPNIINEVCNNSLTSQQIQQIATNFANNDAIHNNNNNGLVTEISTVSSSSSYSTSSIDWTFLNVFDDSSNNNHGDNAATNVFDDYGGFYFSDLEIMHSGEFFCSTLPPPPSPRLFEEEDRVDDDNDYLFSHRSFLWNF